MEDRRFARWRRWYRKDSRWRRKKTRRAKARRAKEMPI
jgi:hypothetical protein